MSGKHTPAGEHSQPAQTIEGPAGPDPASVSDEIAHLREAIRSQRDIGMAIGLVSARFGVSTEQAWRTMVRISQDSNTKVRHMAHALVTTRDGSADDADRELLRSFVAHLPASGWPQGSWSGNDAAP